MAEGRLETIAPAEAVEWYLDHRRDDTSTATRRKQSSALGTFVDWTEQFGLDDMNDVRGRQLMRFKTWRKNETEVNTVSLNGNLAILRRFLVFCETIDAVEKDLADRVPLPNVPRDEEVSDVVPTDEAVHAMRAYYRKFEYASRRQTQLELITEVGLRMGAVRSIDLDDLDTDMRVIHLRHRPEGPDVHGTPLKNGPDGERMVNLSAGLVETIQDYIDHHRFDVEDDYYRSPLFTTQHGRVTRATIRRDFYKLTRPCMYSGECPHDRDISACEGTKDSKTAECPSRYSTHPFRKWSIMHQLDAGVSMELLSDRVDVSVPILEKHYDHRSEERKSRRRLEELEDKLPAFTAD
jgi:site-specific recombinase XerD